jgi:microcystin degradation protein MlrC
MTKRFFFSALATETNTFSNIPTTKESFEVHRGQTILEGPDASASLKALVADLKAADIEVVAALSAIAYPGAATQQQTYEDFRGEILGGLRAAAPVDAVLLELHGAMVAQDCFDCEGDLLARIRAEVGPDTPIGAVLDPHAHLTQQMVDNASVMAFMKEYPHTDGPERTADVLRILRRMIDEGVRPTPAMFDCRLIGFFPTQRQPMRGFVDRMIAREGVDGVLTASFVHGFPWGDTPHTGAKVLVYTDGDPHVAAVTAKSLHEEIWSIKDETLPAMVSVQEAVADMTVARAGPLVVADFADNPGGGAPSDSTYLLRAVLDAEIESVGFGLFFDPCAVRLCHQVGVGGKLDLRIGGKVGRVSGEPVDLAIEVMGLAKEAKMDMGLFGVPNMPMGDTAWVRGRGVDLILSSSRIQMYDRSGFTHLGLDPTCLSAVVVKSSNHFAASFVPIAAKVLYVGGPGALDTDFARLGYRVFSAPYYPRVADPFGLSS